MLPQTTCSGICGIASPSSRPSPTQTISTRGAAVCSLARNTTSRRPKTRRFSLTMTKTGSCSPPRPPAQSNSTGAWRTAGQPARRARSGGSGRLPATACLDAVVDEGAITTSFRATSSNGLGGRFESSTCGNDPPVTRIRTNPDREISLEAKGCCIWYDEQSGHKLYTFRRPSEARFPEQVFLLEVRFLRIPSMPSFGCSGSRVMVSSTPPMFLSRCKGGLTCRERERGRPRPAPRR